MHRRWVAAALAAGSLALGAMSAAAAGAATLGGVPTASGVPGHWLPETRATSAAATTNPTTNVTPSPDYWSVCLQAGTSSQSCNDAVVAAIDNARSLEGVGPMVLPTGFASMSPAEQTFVVSNLERVDRGLAPAAGMVGSLNTLSSDAAAADADPMLPSFTVGTFTANGWGSIWAGDLNALAADYDWMYNDGWGPAGSVNLDCTSTNTSGCWGHRDNILMPAGVGHLITGVGSVTQSQWTSIAQIFVTGSGSYPPFTIAWSDVAGGSPAPTGTTPDPTSTDVTAPATVVAGQQAWIVGRLTDVVAGSPVTGATVRLCRRAVTSVSATCTTMTTDATGAVALSTRPKVSTVYWLVFRGTPTLAPTKSSRPTVQVRPAVTLQSAHTSGGWQVVAHLTPARGQTVRLRRHTATGWVTVRRTTAATWLTFDRLRSGDYRLVVSAVTSSLGTSAGIHLA